MKINIVLITYNHSAYIRQAIESILMQKTSCDVEIIVADDASTDDTLQIIKSYSTNNTFTFKFLPEQKNLGLVKNYQRAFAACDGKYVAVMEGDDYWTDPERLEKHITFLENHRECSMSYNRIIYYFADKYDYRILEWKSEEEYIYITTKQLIKGNLIGNLSACVFRKIELDKIKSEIYDLYFADWLLGMALGEYGLIAQLKETMSVYRVHSSGLWSGQTNSQQIDEVLGYLPEYDKFLGFKYHEDFVRFERYLKENREKKKFKLSSYVPPLITYLIKLLVPPVLLKK